MLILGMLSVLQICFLPGYLAVRAMRMDDGAIKAWVLSFTLSLVINHLLVFALVTFHVYYSSTVYFIFGVELVILAWMQYVRLGMPAASLLAKDWQRVRDLLAQLDESEPPTRWVGGIILFTAVVTFLIYLLRFAGSSHVFTFWDAVVSWNRWAVEWHNNQFPRNTHEYPQLLPSNLSISYVFIGNAIVQLFAKMTMPLFPLTILLAVTDLGLRSRNLGLILSVSTTGALLLWLSGDLIDSGYADTPMACMAFASVYMLLISKDEASDTERQKNLLIGAVLSGGAALTKQPGLYLAAVYPLLSSLLVLNGPKGSRLIEKAKAVALLYFTSAVLIAPWYLFLWSRMMTGVEVPVALALTSDLFHHGRNTLERLMFAINSIERKLGPILMYLVILLGPFCIAFHKTWRWLLIAVVVPWFFVWATLFSYDTRNLALIMPLVGVMVGIGLYERVGGYAVKFVTIVMRGEWRIVALVILIASVILNFIYPGERLVRHQLERQKSIGNERINQALYKYHEKYGLKGRIATPYPFLEWLPGLEQYYSPVEVYVPLEQFLGKVEKLDPTYFLWQARRANPNINRYVREKINSGEYTVIFDIDGTELIELRDHPIRNQTPAK